MRIYNVLVITPSTLRPEILTKTFSSFCGNCFDKYRVSIPRSINSNRTIEEDESYGCNIRLVINIDYVSECEVLGHYECSKIAEEIDFIASKFFYKQKTLSCHQEEQCSLASAFHRLWTVASISNSDYVFYLEDDWLLKKEVDLIDMLKIMDHNPNLAILRLNFKPSNPTYTKQWRHIFSWNGEYYKCPNEDKKHIGFCGHPSLINPKFIKDTVKLINNSSCPERQMKGLYGETPMKRIIEKWDYGVYGKGIDDQPYIEDIGRQWRSEHNIIKLADTTWRKKQK